MTPRLSIVIPNYNHARFLPKRLESVLNQTFQDVEIIFLDDASTDNSKEVFAAYAGDPRIRHIFNDVNSGCVFKQWNKGFREATGEYVWIAESDDYADPDLLATLVEQLDRHPTAGVAYCQSQAVDADGQHLFIVEDEWWGKTIDPNRWKKDFCNNGRDECARYLIRVCTIPNASAAVIRRDVVQSIGYADETLRLAGDYMFWVKMMLASDVAYVAKPLNYWRTHANTVRASSTSDGTSILENYKIAAHILATVDATEADIEVCCAHRFNNWMWLKETNNISKERSREIYAIASMVDPRLRRRLAAYPFKRRWNQTRKLLGRLKRLLGRKSGPEDRGC